MEYDIGAAIPHRAPFLLLDEIVEIAADGIRAAATLRPDGELWSRVYSGHYPGNPITPGVLLCEMIFQAAAVLMHETAKGEPLAGVPVVTRIRNVKFRAMAFPGDTVEIRANLAGRAANAFFLKGGVWKNGKPACQAEFTAALVSRGGRDGDVSDTPR